MKPNQTLIAAIILSIAIISHGYMTSKARVSIAGTSKESTSIESSHRNMLEPKMLDHNSGSLLMIPSWKGNRTTFRFYEIVDGALVQVFLKEEDES